VGSDETRIGFETDFERPELFSFSFTAESSASGGGRAERYSCRIDCNGALVRMEGDLPPDFDRPDSLGLAIASLTGVSFGSAHTIPRLLMPDLVEGRELFGFKFRAMGDPVLIDGESHHALYLRESALLMLVFVNEATLVVRRTEGPHPVSVTDYFASLTP
jgi:hypothetical protein